MSVPHAENLTNFAYLKFAKPPRLNSEVAVNKGKAAAQRLLDAGYKQIQIMQMLAFVTAPRTVVAEGEWDGDIAWWRARIYDLPSLAAEVLDRESKFVIQFELQAAKLREWLTASGHSNKEWVEDQQLAKPRFPQLQKEFVPRPKVAVKVKQPSKPDCPNCRGRGGKYVGEPMVWEECACGQVSA